MVSSIKHPSWSSVWQSLPGRPAGRQAGELHLNTSSGRASVLREAPPSVTPPKDLLAPAPAAVGTHYQQAADAFCLVQQETANIFAWRVRDHLGSDLGIMQLKILLDVGKARSCPRRIRRLI
jgi:hypothetical protein